MALGAAVARIYPLYNKKTTLSNTARTVTVEFLFVGENKNALSKCEVQCLTASAESIRLAARIVDTPTNEMTTNTFVKVCTQTQVSGFSLFVYVFGSIITYRFHERLMV